MRRTKFSRLDMSRAQPRKLSSTLRGMKKLCRKNIGQLKYLLKIIDKGTV